MPPHGILDLIDRHLDQIKKILSRMAKRRDYVMVMIMLIAFVVVTTIAGGYVVINREERQMTEFKRNMNELSIGAFITKAP